MSKKYDKAQKLVDKKKSYQINKALELMPKISTSKFPGSIELHITFNLSEKQQKESLKGAVVFPNQFGKTKKVLVLTDTSHQKEAEDAGADFVGLEEYIKKIETGWDDFDIVIATPSVMPKIAKLGKFLGRKGLMPNPKNQTVTNDLKKVIKMYKQGKTDFKVQEGNLKIILGKVDMNPKQLVENFEEFTKSLYNVLPRLTKDMIRSIYLTPTMGPSIKIDPNILVTEKN